MVHSQMFEVEKDSPLDDWMDKKNIKDISSQGMYIQSIPAKDVYIFLKYSII